MNNNAISYFGLTTSQSQILFSLERMLVINDIPATAVKKKVIINYEKRAKVKKQWLALWEKSINDYLTHLDNSNSRLLMTHSEIVQSILEENKKTETEIWKYLILLECCFLAAYTPLGGTQEEIEESGKLFAGLKLDKESRKKTLLEIAALLDIDSKYVEVFEKSKKAAFKRLSNYWYKVAVSAGVGLLIAIILLIPGVREIAMGVAPEGLHGAAAVQAGLAALGGGAISAGGLGMAGGFAVVVGGGALLGIGAGGSVGLLIASNNSKAILGESVKLEVVLREIVLAIQNDTLQFQQILNKLSAEKEALKLELERLKKAQKENQKKIKELKKSIDYLERLIKDLRK